MPMVAVIPRVPLIAKGIAAAATRLNKKRNHRTGFDVRKDFIVNLQIDGWI
jgi:hypothetical protein